MVLQLEHHLYHQECSTSYSRSSLFVVNQEWLAVQTQRTTRVANEMVLCCAAYLFVLFRRQRLTGRSSTAGPVSGATGRLESSRGQWLSPSRQQEECTQVLTLLFAQRQQQQQQPQRRPSSRMCNTHQYHSSRPTRIGHSTSVVGILCFHATCGDY